LLALEHALRLAALGRGPAAGEFVRAQEAVLDQNLVEGGEPDLVIGRGEILRRRQALAGMADLVDRPGAHGAGRDVDRQHALFPAAMEDGLVRLGHDRAETHLAAEIMGAVHAASSTRGRPVPIMESRETMLASFSSLQPSVPAGRIGMTMKRVSAVES